MLFLLVMMGWQVGVRGGVRKWMGEWVRGWVRGWMRGWEKGRRQGRGGWIRRLFGIVMIGLWGEGVIEGGLVEGGGGLGWVLWEEGGGGNGGRRKREASGSLGGLGERISAIRALPY